MVLDFAVTRPAIERGAFAGLRTGSRLGMHALPSYIDHCLAMAPRARFFDFCSGSAKTVFFAMRRGKLFAKGITAMAIVADDAFVPMDILRQIIGGNMKSSTIPLPQICVPVAHRAHILVRGQLRAGQGRGPEGTEVCDLDQ